MIFKRINSPQLCNSCGEFSLLYILDRPITDDFLQLLLQNSFRELPNFKKIGILNVESNILTLTGSFNKDSIKLKCKNKDSCSQKINEFEEFLAKI